MTARIVATGDNHLGQYIARLPSRLLTQRGERLRQAFGEVVDTAIARGAHFLIVAGDIFDTSALQNPDCIYLARRLAELRQHGIPVIAIPSFLKPKISSRCPISAPVLYVSS